MFYGLRWKPSVETMLVVSVGTGYNPAANENLRSAQMNIVYNARSVPSALMFAAMNQQDTLCRVFGDCKVGGPIDREMGDIHHEQGPAPAKLFSYLRYNVELSPSGLAALGLGAISARKVARLDAVNSVEDLRRIGRGIAARDVDPAHFRQYIT